MMAKKNNSDDELIVVEETTPAFVRIRVLKISFTFAKDKDGTIRIVARSNPAQIYDRKNSWVPAGLFNQACRKAVGILKYGHRSKSALPLFPNMNLN
jgi:hypothetical protein